MTRIVRAVLAVVALLSMAACEPLNGSNPEPDPTPSGWIAGPPTNAFPMVPFDPDLGVTTLQVEILYHGASIVEDEVKITATGFVAGAGGFVPAQVTHTNADGTTTTSPMVDVSLKSVPFGATSTLQPGVAFATYVVEHLEVNDGAQLSCRITQGGKVLSQDLAQAFPGLQVVTCVHLAVVSPN